MWGEGPLGHFTEFPQSQHGKRSIPWILAPKSTAGSQAVESHMTLIQSNIRMARVFTMRPRVGQKWRERETETEDGKEEQHDSNLYGPSAKDHVV